MNFWTYLKIAASIAFISIIGVAAFVANDNEPAALQQQAVPGNTTKFNF